MEQPHEQVTARTIPAAMPASLPIPGVLPVIGIALVLVGVVLLVQLSGVTSAGYDLRRLQAERTDWQRENQMLESYVANLQSIEHVERVVTGRLALGPTQERVFIKVSRTPVAGTIAEEQPPMPFRPAIERETDSVQTKIARWLSQWLAVTPPAQAATRGR